MSPRRHEESLASIGASGSVRPVTSGCSSGGCARSAGASPGCRDFDSDAICLTCENARPCVRCGKTEFRIGMRTPYGPACIGCTPYFKAPEPCEACGTESRWLSRRKELGHDLRLCPRCARKGSHGTCAACRRHRLVEPSAWRPQAVPGVPRAGRDSLPGMQPADAGRLRETLLDVLLGTARPAPDPDRQRRAGVARLGEAVRRIRCVARREDRKNARPR